ncbi:Metalloreductase STEAP3 [Portunus trituberculatus]|uniref:Metalloreductase STEAP3 n=1 Tax=Portunus trituberculatus TaxID=210409 RepID=A0A5B7GAS2_PORTR|nr:Metalloreductase STEAP3 [Portunus trituberculatus]
MCLWPPHRDLVRAKPGCRLVTQEEAAKADMVVVAVGADHYHRLPLGMLKHKVVIDVANFTAPPSPHQPSNAEMLQQMIPQAQVVKSFNVLSAYALENNVQQQAKQVPVASDWPEARRRVLELVKQMGYSPVDKGPLKFARDIEAIPLQLMPSWRKPMMVIGSLFVFHYLLLLFKTMFNNALYKGHIIYSLLFMVRQMCLGVAVWSGTYDPLVWEPPFVASLDVRVNSTTLVTQEIPIYSNRMSLRGELFLTFGM